MKFTLGEIYGLTISLQKLTDKELPIKVSYRLLTFLKDCSTKMETLEKTRIKLIKKYAEKKEDGKEDGKEMKVSDENKDKFQEEFSTLLSEEVEIKFNPITIDEIGDISLSANDLIPMQKIIKEK